MDLKASLLALKCERVKIEVGFQSEKKLVFPHVVDSRWDSNQSSYKLKAPYLLNLSIL